jgi:hypothetical protein
MHPTQALLLANVVFISVSERSYFIKIFGMEILEIHVATEIVIMPWYTNRLRLQVKQFMKQE